MEIKTDFKKLAQVAVDQQLIAQDLAAQRRETSDRIARLERWYDELRRGVGKID